jgi:hypothetical protein
MHSHIHATSASLLIVSSQTALQRTAESQRAMEVRKALLRASSSTAFESEPDELSMVDGDAGGGERQERRAPTPRRRVGDRQGDGATETVGHISRWA